MTSTQTVPTSEQSSWPASPHAAMVKRTLLDGISSVSGYVAYVHPRINWWCAEATVPTERPRSVRIEMTVIDNPDTDWQRLSEELRARTKAEFRNPGGCVVSIESDPSSPGGFRLALGRPYSEDLRQAVLPSPPVVTRPRRRASRK